MLWLNISGQARLKYEEGQLDQLVATHYHNNKEGENWFSFGSMHLTPEKTALYKSRLKCMLVEIKLTVLGDGQLWGKGR